MSCWLGAFPDTLWSTHLRRTPARKGEGSGSLVHRGEAGIVGLVAPPANPNYIEPTPVALPPMHVVTYGADQFCAVDDKGTVACRVGDHGFVDSDIDEAVRDAHDGPESVAATSAVACSSAARMFRPRAIHIADGM